MKLNKISMMLAAVALVGCSDDLGERFTDQALEDTRLIQLDANFALGGVADEGATTRSHWELTSSGSVTNQFLPILKAAGSANDPLTTVGVTADEVGLCWLGQSVGSDVYTNYQFTHAGWLYTAQKNPEIFCGNLENGIWYSETQLKAAGTANKEPALTNLKGQSSPINKSAAVFNVNPLNPTDYDVNLNSGVYKTENKSIFGGDYIVYYPFNENFKEAGTIPAIAVTQFGDGSTTSAPKALTDPALAKATFRYSTPVTIKGGDQAAGFKMRNLSTLVQLKVSTTDEDPIGSSDKIDQIVLYSANEQLLAQANLAANKIVAGEDPYASTEGTKTIVANFKSTEVLTGITSATPQSAFITVLPTTVEDLVVLVHSNNLKKWAKVNIGEETFKAGGAKVLDITVKTSDFKAEYIAVDDASLATAIAEIASTEATIEVIGDITVSSKTIPANVTVQGDKLIVPEDVTLNLSCNMESDIRVLGKSCCSGNWGGRLVIYAGATINNVTMVPTEAEVKTDSQYETNNPKVTFNGATTVAADSKVDVQAGNVVVNAAVAHKGNFEVAEGAKVLVESTGDLNFMGATVVNNGTIEVKKNGKFDMTDANGNATANDGKNMTNNGKFIHNVDAVVGTAVQAMTQNGEYRCKVDEQKKLDDAYLQWTACNVIDMVNVSAVSYDLGTASKITTDAAAKTAPYKHNNNFIDIEINGPTYFVDNSTTGDGKNIQIGNLTVKQPFIIDYTKTTGTKRTLTVNGDMKVIEVNAFIQSSQLVEIKKNLTIQGTVGTEKFKYFGSNANGSLKVGENITVNKAIFDASDDNALNINCTNFSLENGATAIFGNRTTGDAKNMTVSSTISNASGCTFNILPASGGNVLAWITCTQLNVGGSFPGGKPKVVD